MGSFEGLFACQRDSFLKELDVEVVSCTPSTLKIAGSKPIKGFDVIFTDTVLFPEGGGQNDDFGTVNGLPVKKVSRKNGKAIHFVEAGTPLACGEVVSQKVDWKRRFDHMQQHSGQHLISAYFEKLLNIDTLSWWMADNQDMTKVGVSHIELDAENIDAGMLDQVEQACNEAVRNHIDVLTHVYQAGSEDLKAASTRAEALGRPLTRGLPDDHVGAVRVIQIGTENNEIDNNMCCGTHVTNLSQLQMIKLLYNEKSKHKGKSLVYFLVGDRVNQHLSQCFSRERELTGVLNGGPEYHSALSEKALKNSKKYQKTSQTLLKEIASLKVTELKAGKPKFYSVHRQESDMDFCNVLLFEMAEEAITIFITMGNDKDGPCSLVLQSNEESIIKELGKKIMDMLGAKGGGKGRRLNGKFISLSKRNDVDNLIKQYFVTNTLENLGI